MDVEGAGFGGLGVAVRMERNSCSLHQRKTSRSPLMQAPTQQRTTPAPNIFRPAARQVFGHEKAAVLEGGLPGWKAAGLKLESGVVSDDELAASARAARAPGGGQRYKASLRRDKVRRWMDGWLVVPALALRYPIPPVYIHEYAHAETHSRIPPHDKTTTQVKSLAEMRDLVNARSNQILDARPAGRFKGVDPEPRAGLRGGHMPGAKNVPFGLVSGCFGEAVC